jgi:hypothetical protein
MREGRGVGGKRPGGGVGWAVNSQATGHPRWTGPEKERGMPWSADGKRLEGGVRPAAEVWRKDQEEGGVPWKPESDAGNSEEAAEVGSF